VYGYLTLELSKRVERGEVAFGGRVTFEGMPTHKCRRCHTTFAVGQRVHIVLSVGKLVASFILFIFVGYFAGSATIVADSVVKSVIPQVLSASITSATPVADIAFWLLGLFAAIGLEVIGFLTKSKAILWGGFGYVAGFLLSAWILNAWWTIVIEVISLVLFLMVFAMLSE
jgi:hypothetical protein